MSPLPSLDPLPSRSSSIQVTATLMTIMRTTMMMQVMMTMRAMMMTIMMMVLMMMMMGRYMNCVELYTTLPYASGVAMARGVLDSLMSATYFNASALRSYKHDQNLNSDEISEREV